MLAVAVLAIVIYTVVSRGASALSLDFVFDAAPTGSGRAGRHRVIVGIATAIAMPIGVAIALFLTEYAGSRAAAGHPTHPRLLNGLPSIIIGLFIFGLLVDQRQPSALAGAVALAIIEVPLIARGTQEVLLLVPKSLREAPTRSGSAAGAPC